MLYMSVISIINYNIKVIWDFVDDWLSFKEHSDWVCDETKSEHGNNNLIPHNNRWRKKFPSTLVNKKKKMDEYSITPRLKNTFDWGFGVGSCVGLQGEKTITKKNTSHVIYTYRVNIWYVLILQYVYIYMYYITYPFTEFDHSTGALQRLQAKKTYEISFENITYKYTVQWSASASHLPRPLRGPIAIACPATRWLRWLA